MQNVGIVFVHGAGLGGWIWKDVVKNIQIPYVCADFPARTEPQELRKDIDFDTYVQSVLDQANAMEVEKIVVVGHSLGGVVAVKVADILGDRLAGFIGVGAAIPKNGGSFLSTLGFPKTIIMGAIMRMAGTKPPVSAIRQGLCNDLSDEQAQEVVDRFAPESLALYTTKTHATVQAVPKQYVLLGQDKEFGLAMQKRMAANLGGSSVTLETGHMPMIAKPAELAKIINDFIA